MRTLVLICVSVVFVGCLSANRRHLPLASAIMVHSCAITEAQLAIGIDPDAGSAISEATISLAASGGVTGGLGVEGGVELIKGTGSFEAVRAAEKTVEVKLTRFPTMAQCTQWGYFQQLCNNGSFNPPRGVCEEDLAKAR